MACSLPMGNDVIVTINLPEELLESAKRVAANEGRTLDSLIAEGLRLVLGVGE